MISEQQPTIDELRTTDDDSNLAKGRERSKIFELISIKTYNCAPAEYPQFTKKDGQL